MENLLKRFLKYVSYDTQSDASSTSFPSTAKQLILAELLVAELHELGVKDAYLSETGYVYGTVLANQAGITPVGLIAHLDTAGEVSGANVKPQVIKNYPGGDIKLSDSVITKVSDFPFLNDLIGKTLVVTDGETLLGADDKAGIAEIITLVEYYHLNPTVKHGEIKICFTPDEEIGQGTVNFDYNWFQVPFAYTLDGGPVGSIEYENFNAASAEVTITGVSIHPGSAKNKMINALNLAHEFHSLLPVNARPEYTNEYEGFIHLTDIQGEIELAQLKYIIREHDQVKFEQLKDRLLAAQDYLNQSYGHDYIQVKLTDSYYNMREYLADKMEIIDLAKQAIASVGLSPVSLPIRGGTDGAVLTYLGLPCPNLGTGGYNYHSRNEFAVVEEMVHSVKIMQTIVGLLVEKAN